MVCSRCEDENTEYSTFNATVGVDKIVFSNRFLGFLAKIIGGVGTTNVLVCQRCQSLMFRKLDRAK